MNAVMNLRVSQNAGNFFGGYLRNCQLVIGSNDSWSYLEGESVSESEFELGTTE